MVIYETVLKILRHIVGSRTQIGLAFLTMRSRLHMCPRRKVVMIQPISINIQSKSSFHPKRINMRRNLRIFNFYIILKVHFIVWNRQYMVFMTIVMFELSRRPSSQYYTSTINVHVSYRASRIIT